MNTNRRDFIRRTGMLAGLAILAPDLYAKKLTAMPRVLILGDSISIGYTPYVKEMLASEAEVTRPNENCQGTTNGIKKIDQWLGDTHWDVIHFNFGLHDLKHVDAVTGKNSDNPKDPQQADIRQYAKNLQVITEKIKNSSTKAIFATTTPFPATVKNPVRYPEDAPKYNRSALKIMRKYHIAIDDLYAFALQDKIKALQIPDNVHFTKEGSMAIAQHVADSIRTALRS